MDEPTVVARVHRFLTHEGLLGQPVRWAFRTFSVRISFTPRFMLLCSFSVTLTPGGGVICRLTPHLASAVPIGSHVSEDHPHQPSRCVVTRMVSALVDDFVSPCVHAV